MYFTQNSIKREELDFQSDKLSILENDFDYEYIIRCLSDSTGKIYETRNGINHLQFSSFYQHIHLDLIIL